MKPILLGATLLVAALAAQDAGAQQRVSSAFAGVRKYAVVITGDYVVPAGTTVSGSVMVFRGNLDVYGNIDGAATAVGGDVIVHEGAQVRGGAVALMGHVRNDGGSILGVIKDMGPTHNRSTVSFGGRPRTTLGSLSSAFLWLIALLVIGTFVLFFMGGYLKRTVEVITHEMGRAIFTGALGGLAVVPALVALVIAMAITIIGILFIPIGVAGIAIARKPATETPAGAELQFLFTGILAFLALWIVAAAFTWFPVVGALLRMLAVSVTFVAVVTGFGAVILTYWRGRPHRAGEQPAESSSKRE